jgi:two-component system, LytTR family, sensor kinase
MDGYSLNKQEKKKHLLIWAIIMVLEYSFDPIPGSIQANIVGGMITFINFMFVYYMLALYVFPRWFITKWFKLFIAILLILSIYSVVDYINYIHVLPALNGHPKVKSITKLIVDQLFFGGIVGVCSIVLYLNKYNVLRISIQTLKENQILNKELTFLKDQYNNHLTFNFLNFCYRDLYQKSEAAANAIETYSEVLNYSLNALSGESAPLRAEVDYILNFLELQKILSKNVEVNFNCTGNIQDKYITPQILIILIEEAFIKGEISETKHSINISLNATDKNLHFSVDYKVKQNGHNLEMQPQKVDINEILNEVYYNKHKLKTKINNGIYSQELTLTL